MEDTPKGNLKSHTNKRDGRSSHRYDLKRGSSDITDEPNPRWKKKFLPRAIYQALGTEGSINREEALLLKVHGLSDHIHGIYKENKKNDEGTLVGRKPTPTGPKVTTTTPTKESKKTQLRQ
jgi:hypothetical protein